MIENVEILVELMRVEEIPAPVYQRPVHSHTLVRAARVVRDATTGIAHRQRVTRSRAGRPRKVCRVPVVNMVCGECRIRWERARLW